MNILTSTRGLELYVEIKKYWVKYKIRKHKIRKHTDLPRWIVKNCKINHKHYRCCNVQYVHYICFLMYNNELFLKFKTGSLATRSARSGKIKLCNNVFIQAPTHPHPRANTHISHRCTYTHAHIHVHTCTTVNCLRKVQSSITKTTSGGQILNFKKKSNDKCKKKLIILTLSYVMNWLS